MNKGKQAGLGFIAASVGLGAAMCVPVVGWGVALAGVLSLADGLASAPPSGMKYKPHKPVQAFLANTMLAAMFLILATLGSLACEEEVCGVTPQGRLIALGVFSTMLALAAFNFASVDDYTEEEAKQVLHQREQKEWRKIWDNKRKFYLRTAFNVPDGETYRAQALDMYRGTVWSFMFPELEQEHREKEETVCVAPLERATIVLARQPKRAALPAPILIQVSEDNGLSWFAVEQLTSANEVTK